MQNTQNHSPKLTDYVTFNDRRLERRCARGKISIATFYEAYFAGDVDLKTDIFELLKQRDLFFKYTLTAKHFKWALTNFIPEVTIHSKRQDTRIVREHYDRGNDFFGWFLGERMVYTSGFFTTPGDTLEQSQDHKMNLVCRKLQLKPGEKLLDIGCGWGTLVRHSAQYYGTDSTGITIAERQTEFGNSRIKEWGLENDARILCRDYRDTPRQKFDKIVSLEMVEHVGVKNLVPFYKLVNELLDDRGLFVLQWTGLRRGLRPEDLIWGLFMNKFVFPGADASLCPSAMLKPLEKAGWELHSLENVSQHYGWTIKHWHTNWMSNREKVLATYGERWFRIWNFFLAWSTFIADQGNAACFQLTLNKNMDAYDRRRWVLNKSPVFGERSSDALVSPKPAPAMPSTTYEAAIRLPS